MQNRALSHLSMALPLAIGVIVGITDHFPVLAQLTPDNTLGAENSTVTVEQFRDLIRGGAIRGNALFHSFDEFNVNELGQNGQIKSVFFDLQNNGNILNILTRVTGNSSSQILGTLGVLNDLGNANLFLLNPNGISFGGNASLDLNGSFFATTADGFGFDNFTFSASGEEAPPPLLTVNIPPFLSFRDNPEDIAVNRDGILGAPQDTISGVNQVNLSVNQGQNLSLVGGNVTVEGGQLNAPGGRIELAGMFVAGNVTINDDFSLTFPDAVIPDGFSLDDVTNADDTGTLTINANILNLNNGVEITSQTENADEGRVIINTGESLNITNGSRIFAGLADGTGNSQGITINSPNVLVDGQLPGRNSSILVFGGNSLSEIPINAGNLEISTNTLNISNRGLVQTLSIGAVNVGAITINATESANITSGGNILAQAQGVGDVRGIAINSPVVSLEGSDIGNINSSILVFGGNSLSEIPTNAGNLEISTNTLNIGNRGQLQTLSTGTVNVGEITINATESVNITGGGNILSQTQGAGDVGGIVINSPIVSVEGNNRDSSILLQVGRNINFLNNGLGNASDPSNLNTTGNVGRLEINTRTLSLDGTGGNAGGQLSAQIWGVGNIGDDVDGNFTSILINATESVIFNNRSLIFAETRASGSLGDVIINTPNLELNENSLIFSQTGTNFTGTETDDLIAADNDLATGNVGDIRINVDTLTLTHSNPIFRNEDGSKIQSETFGVGEAGDIIINATESISVSSDFTDLAISSRSLINSDFSSQSERQTGENPQAGNITINTSSLSLNNSEVRANTRGNGNAGTININASDSIFLENGGTISSSTEFIPLTGLSGNGNAGDVTIEAGESISLTGNSTINSNLEEGARGNGGNIRLQARNLNINDGATIGALTGGDGDAGTIKIDVSDTVIIDGADREDADSGILAFASETSTGNAGSINIDPQQVTVRNGGTISVQSSGIGTAGDLTIFSDNLTLDNGTITAQTENTNGGNITLNIIDLLLLRNGDGNPLISTEAGQGDGGNIDINADLIVAFPGENSDISANGGSLGGIITIRNSGIFGIQPRGEGGSDATNDITATGGISGGSITIEELESDLNQEQIEEPEEVVDSSDIVSQSVCYDFGGGGQLRNTGRSGIPPTPELAIRSEVVNVDLAEEVLPAPPPEAIKPHHRTDVTFINSEGEEFKPAMGAVLLPNGMVQFVDYSPAEVYRDMYAAAGCSN